MPRSAQPREAAEPASDGQRARYVRMLQAAAEVGSENEFERVQMQEVAKRAGVALATLYRYFPSKVHLFVGVMIHQIDQLAEGVGDRRSVPVKPPEEAVYDLLLGSMRAMLRRPLLSRVMLQAMSAARATAIPDVAKIDRRFREVLFTAAGIDIDRVTENDAGLMRVLVYTWFGIIQPCVNGRLSAPDAEADLWVACRLLLRELSTAR